MKDQDKVRRIVPILHWQIVNVQSWYCLNYLVDQDRNVKLDASRLIAVPMYVILRMSWRQKLSSFKLFGFSNLLPSRYLGSQGHLCKSAPLNMRT